MTERQLLERLGRKARNTTRFSALFVAALVGFSTSMLVDARSASGQGPGMMGPGMMERGGCMGMNCPGGPGQGMMGQSGGSTARHHQYMMGGVPEPYASMRDPLPDSSEVIARGRDVFEENCASCHGPQGLGDGEAGRELSPPPSNLAALMRMPMMRGDSYLYWTIAQGGAPFGTAMPAFEETLSADEIWSVVHFLQADLPQAAGETAR